jgi:hypothetical protein
VVGLAARELVLDAEHVVDERVRGRAARAEHQSGACVSAMPSGSTKPIARRRRIISSAVGADTPTLRATSACVGAPPARSRSNIVSR